MWRLPPYSIDSSYEPKSLKLWNLEMVNAPSFWKHSKGGGRVVAVIDTGCNVNHSEFADRAYNPLNCTSIGGWNDVTDTEGHGTHMAGTIGGRTVGVAPECRIMPIKVFGDNNVGNNISEAFRRIIEHNKTCAVEDRVVAVNCSFSGGFYDAVMAYMIRRLVNDGVVVCVAAGNSGDGKHDSEEIFSFPAYIYEVVTVASVDQDGHIANYSNSFDGIDIAAPGSSIYSASKDGGYITFSGTSCATPHVTGACALLADAIYQREGRMPLPGEIDAISDNLAQANGCLFKHIKPSKLHPNFVGQGILDLTYNLNRFPLYHNQVGAYYYKEGAESVSNDLKKTGFSNFVVKY